MVNARRDETVVPLETAHKGTGPGADPDALIRAWRTSSLTSGWPRPADWWLPEVDAVAEALSEGHPQPLDRFKRLGKARAQAGTGLRETLDDLCALYRHLPLGVPPATVLCAVAEAWADGDSHKHRGATCTDPLTGLVTLPYLRTRLAEMYREAERSGIPVTRSHAFVLIDGVAVRPPPGVDSHAHQLALGACLRLVFPGGESFAAVSPTVLVGLVTRVLRLPAMVVDLKRRLVEEVGITPPPRVWIEGLPPTLPLAYELLGDFAL